MNITNTLVDVNVLENQDSEKAGSPISSTG